MKNFGAQNMVTKVTKVLMKKPSEFMSKADIKKWNYKSSLNQEKIEKNYEEFFNIIKKSGTEIIELKIKNKKEDLFDSIFTHDPSLVINEGAIILNMGKKLRKKETDEHKKIYNRINIPIVGKIKGEGTVEGGDCLWINDNTLLIGRSLRTNENGIKQLAQILKNFEIKVIPVKLPKQKDSNSCFHLMSLISMLDHDLAIGCKSLISSELKEIFNKNSVKIISIPEDEYFNSETMAVNCLALSPRNLVLIKGYPKTEDVLVREGNKLNLFNGDDLCKKAEGGPTCLTRALIRI